MGRARTRPPRERSVSRGRGITFTLPSELRALFHGPGEADAFRAFFAAASSSLRDVLANPRWLGAHHSGFSMILHTWNRRLAFHPHIHAIVPDAGVADDGRVVTVKSAGFLVPQPVLRTRFRTVFRERVRTLPGAPPSKHPVWQRDWGVDIRPFGDGANIIRYLALYVHRTAISDSRIVRSDEHTVTFSWRPRDKSNATRTDTIPGTEFVARYLRHVAPTGLRTIRHYGFHHPAARKRRERIAFHLGSPLLEPSAPATPQKPNSAPACPGCGKPMRIALTFKPAWRSQCFPNAPRAPPMPLAGPELCRRVSTFPARIGSFVRIVRKSPHSGRIRPFAEQEHRSQGNFSRIDSAIPSRQRAHSRPNRP